MSYVQDGVTYYTVRFLNYAADDLLGTADVPEGGDATPYAPEPEAFEDKVFVRWNIDITRITEDITVRQVFRDLFTVTFMNRNGTDTLSVQYVDTGGDAIPPTPEQVSGSIFIGWSDSFRNVDENRTVYPLYREIPPKPILNFYAPAADGSSGRLVKSYPAVNSCSIIQKLSGECSIEVKLLTRKSEGYVDVNSRLEVEGLVFYISGIHKTISGGI